MNRKIWLDEYSELPCPSCGEGVLKEANHELKNQTLASLEDNNYYRKGQEAPDEHFLVSQHLKCSRCGDWTTVTYKLSYDVRHTDEQRVFH
jgi:ribosomal protein S27AE